MPPEIVKRIAMQVYGMGIFSKVGGLATEHTTTVVDSKRIYISAPITPFFDAQPKTLSPSGSERGFCFFQLSATRVVSQNVWFRSCEHDLTMTYWANGNQVANTQDGYLEAQIIKSVRETPLTVDEGWPIRAFTLEHAGDLFGESANRWGWEDAMLQYNQPPHKIGQVRFRLNYAMSSGCNVAPVSTFNAAC